MIIISKTYPLDEKSHNAIKSLLNKKNDNGTVVLNKEEIAICENVTGKKIEELWISEG